MNLKLVERLTYFGKTGPTAATTQSILEDAFHLQNSGTRRNRQATRYSVHGLHDYKGKFNPQVARAILNILVKDEESVVLDPFCGSGTTLVEASHLGLRSFGFDMNPLAVYIANAKAAALSLDACEISEAGQRVGLRAPRQRCSVDLNDGRHAYLASWFPEENLLEIEKLRRAIDLEHNPSVRLVLLCLASDLLRDYSLQEPIDLRVRRRKSPLPLEPLLDCFRRKVGLFASCLESSQAILGTRLPRAEAYRLDIRQVTLKCARSLGVFPRFDTIVTSPPYATALPYIDTQRLSLVWLGLCSPVELRALERDLIGSRDTRASAPIGVLPPAVTGMCRELKDALSKEDGFRRQAVPRLLGKYFYDMHDMFLRTRALSHKRTRFALIVGVNRTVLGGKSFTIPTPDLLGLVAERAGWKVAEIVRLQTYPRYGLHSANAVDKESLVVLRAA